MADISQQTFVKMMAAACVRRGYLEKTPHVITTTCRLYKTLLESLFDFQLSFMS